jgi:phosphodiesterase/alkaline phosphatase D-like protein
MLEYNPYRINAADLEQIYRSFRYGPMLEVLMLDERSYRGPNSPNRQVALDDESAFLGRAQLDWQERAGALDRDVEGPRKRHADLAGRTGRERRRAEGMVRSVGQRRRRPTVRPRARDRCGNVRTERSRPHLRSRHPLREHSAVLAQNRPPSEGMQYFGIAKIVGQTRAMIVSLHDYTGKPLFSTRIEPEAG